MDEPSFSTMYVPCGLEVPVESEAEARAILGAEQQPSPVRNPDLEIVTVWEGSNPLMLAAAKSALEEAGIPCYVCGERAYRGTGGFLFPSWRSIEVAADRQAEARELVHRANSSL
jgi:hypothetical protein